MGISTIGLGCVTFGREITGAASHGLLDHAIEQGISFFDTASAYSAGASETILGEWLASRRPDPKNITIATKIPPPYEPAQISDQVSQSLERLGLASLDLLYLHKWDETAESLELLTALDQLVRIGLVRRIGVSNCRRDELGRALDLQVEKDLTRFSAVQNNFNFAVSDMNPEYRQFCGSHNIEVVTYSPLGAGFLTGKHKSGVEPGSRFELIPGHQDVYFHEESIERLARLESVAEQSGYSPAHLALSWALHQPGIDTVLVGGRTRAHLDQAIAAKNFEDKAVLAALNEAR